MRISLVVAADNHDAIGRQNDLPWHIPTDLKRFKELTAGRVVIMGNRTHQSIVARLGKALPGRMSIVLARQYGANVTGAIRLPYHGNVEELLSAFHTAGEIARFASQDEVFVLGGSHIYAATIRYADCIYLTRVDASIEDADSFMPSGWLDGFERQSADIPYRTPNDEFPVRFETYKKVAPHG